MTNFKRPYLALSVSEFWKRWHISLSTWFKDYVYIPLGGNRTKKYRWYLNLFLTFLISGLWHGANWTFVVWGGLNGLYLIIEIILQKRKAPLPVIRILITFMLINFSWIFFRSNSITDSVIIIQKIFTQPGNLYIGSGDDIAASIYAVIAISCLVILEIKNEYLKNLFKVNSLTKLIGYAFLIFIILYVGVFDESQFIYFQF
jgi:D-alanyl-lipoteichoic acid acyltransferase DltB (MBOAT superfamily)